MCSVITAIEQSAFGTFRRDKLYFVEGAETQRRGIWQEGARRVEDREKWQISASRPSDKRRVRIKSSGW